MKILTASKPLKDRDVEQIVGTLLRYGVITATLIAFIGGVAYLFTHGSSPMPDYSHFKGEGAGYTSFSPIVSGAFKGQATEIIQLGVIALIATPILRILFSLVAFAFEKDRMYVFITMIVLGVMMVSIFGGLKV
jgi:uncharacterized membrane protein